MEASKNCRVSRLVVATAIFCLAMFATAAAQVTARVSLDSGGAQGNHQSGQPYDVAISSGGRFVAFTSYASNLVAGDTNGTYDVFFRDRQTGVTERVSLDSSGGQGNGSSGAVSIYIGNTSISADGRYVAFSSVATNLVAGDTNGRIDVFVRDRQTGVTERASLASGGAQGNLDSYAQAISADGRYVVFPSSATNLVAGDSNGNDDVFVRDRQNGTTERVSVDSSGAQGNNISGLVGGSISADGRFVAFHSYASNLVAGDTNGVDDLFVRDRQAGVTERVSVASGGSEANAESYLPSISADGSYVAYTSWASNLVAGDTNGGLDVFVRDRQLGITERASVHSTGTQGNGISGGDGLTISADGRHVVFASSATNLVTGDTNGFPDIFVRDRQSGSTERVSLDSSGAQENDASFYPSISADGRYVAFASDASNLVVGDTNGFADVFVRDLHVSGFASLCDPGSSGVISCPCSNPPAGPGRGCDNSSATGGATVSASGVAYLSSDSLVFTTSGQMPTTTSIVVQGDLLTPSGLTFGRGVRCASGSLKHLYTKSASGGSITAPDFGAGDPTVSARSAALGDTIQAGETRWYFVAYRDPIGVCPAAFGMATKQTINATQTGEIAWSL